MSENNPSVYDPASDAMEIELQGFADIGIDELDVNQLCTPQGVAMLVYMRRLALTRLRASEEERSRLSTENAALRDQKEDLRVQIARTETRANNSWLEVPISLLSGFAISLLVQDMGNMIGWLLLVLGLVMLLGIRGASIVQFISRHNRSGENNNG